YTFLTMTLCSHNKHHHSAHTEQFVSKSSCVDRSAFTDDSEPDIAFLIKNLKNVIMKELSILCMTKSSVSSLASSVTSFSAASFSVSFSAASQSSTLTSVSGSPAPATSVPVTLTSITSGFTISAFVISSPQFKKILCRLNESHLSRITLLLNSVKIM
ncbi:hypothetical protein BDFG_08250, partial [Blastomyces dermatitidis ATCC 26199]